MVIYVIDRFHYWNNLTGGTNIKHSKYADVLKFFFDKVIEANARGDYFPLWGTCLGFESLNILAAENNEVVNYGFDSEDLSLSLKFVSDFRNSRLFGSAPNEILEILAQQNVTMNNHMAGVTPFDYERNEKLRKFFKILSLNADRKGKTFVSTIESFNFPIYGTQYHPEKVYEFNYEVIDHSFDSLIANEYFGQFFVNEARKSQRKFPSFEEEEKYLIYNFSPKFTFPRISKDFMQIYYFNATSTI